MVYFQERAFPPFFYGFSEGITTLCMSISYLMAGGDWTMILFWIYLIHFVASFLNHLFPTKSTYFLDIATINLMIMERSYMISGNPWVYVFFSITMFFEREVSSFILVLRIIASMLLFARGQFSFFYIYVCVLITVFYFLSVKFQQEDDIAMATFTCVLYHIYLGILSMIEVELYDKSITNTTDGFVRYCSFFIFISYIMIHLTQNPKRLRSILSFATALVLSPLSIHQILKQIQYSRTETFQGDGHIQYFMPIFYLAYVVIDTIVGLYYYPTYFTFLEGWAHHIGTSIFIVYYSFFCPEKMVLICMNQVIEVSSILLFLSKIFYDVDWIQHLKKKIFFNVFLFFRIIVPTFIIMYFYQLYDGFACFIYASFTSLNLYWLIKIYERY